LPHRTVANERAEDERRRLPRHRGDRREPRRLGRNAVETAAQTVRDLRVAEATRFDVTIEDGKVTTYRVRLDISFRYEGS
jgi:hypothetical protein